MILHIMPKGCKNIIRFDGYFNFNGFYYNLKYFNNNTEVMVQRTKIPQATKVLPLDRDVAKKVFDLDLDMDWIMTHVLAVNTPDNWLFINDGESKLELPEAGLVVCDIFFKPTINYCTEQEKSVSSMVDLSKTTGNKSDFEAHTSVLIPSVVHIRNGDSIKLDVNPESKEDMRKLFSAIKDKRVIFTSTITYMRS